MHPTRADGACDGMKAQSAAAATPARPAEPAAAPNCNPASPAELYALYTQDRLVVHTMPVELAVNERPKQLCSNRSQLKCGSLLFSGGLQHQDGHHIPNAVARFGDPEHKHRTVFASLHDLQAIFATHAQLELSKAPDRQHSAPFVFFSNSDIGNLAKEQPPPDDYMDAVWGESQPAKTLRPQGFNFRQYCSSKREKDDPSMEQEGVEWNELRAVLNRGNMVGLLYIHDPRASPAQHADEARQLLAAFGGQRYVMGVFALRQAGGVQGDLLTVPTTGGQELLPAGGAAGDAAAEGDAGGHGGGSSSCSLSGKGERALAETDLGEDVAPRGGSSSSGSRDQQSAGGAAGQPEGGLKAGGGSAQRLLTFQEYLKQKQQQQERRQGA